MTFGPFRLFPTARAIERDGTRLSLGSRALDILIVLVARAGEVVSHRELISRVWRELVVDASNLRVHVTGLRKVLGDNERQPTYIANVPGQGYCFVAPIKAEESADRAATGLMSASKSDRKASALPPVLSRMVGRESEVRTLVAELAAHRFVTIVGPGGMGKTTVAVAVAHAMLEEFDRAVYFVDFGGVSDPKLLAATMASTVGLAIQAADELPSLMEFLRQARMLLVLDNCEHVIETAAALAERIFIEAPRVFILATSREALRVEGEYANWLPPLESPPLDSRLGVAEVRMYPAVKLFVERAAASNNRFVITDAEVPIVASICNELGGLALAIEFAAGRVGTYGLDGTAKLLNDRLGLYWQGRRTAVPRHQTLHALLDWSYALLTENERLVLRRLSAFVGTFTLAGANAVVCGEDLDESLVVSVVGQLVAKSLVSSVPVDDGGIRHRLLDTTRVFAADKLNESGESEITAWRHAAYFARLMESIGGDHGDPRSDSAAMLGEHLGNVRAALDWCFNNLHAGLAGRDQNRIRARQNKRQSAQAPRRCGAAFAIDLTAACAPRLIELSLLGECQRWSEAALTQLDETTRGSRSEMILQEAKAISSMWTQGNGDDVLRAIHRGLELARSLGETTYRMRLLVDLHFFMTRSGDHHRALDVVEEWQAVAKAGAASPNLALSDWMRGGSQHFLGNQAVAHVHFQEGFARERRDHVQLFGVDQRVRALVNFARTLWLTGHPAQAVQRAEQSLADAEKSGKPLNVCFSLLYTAPVFLWCGEWKAAEALLEKLISHRYWHSLPTWHCSGLALRGESLIHRGETEQGMALLRSALATMRTQRQDLLTDRAVCVLAETMSKEGHGAQALALIADAMSDTERAHKALFQSEMLRIQGDTLLLVPHPDERRAEDCLTRSINSSRTQSARAWELRAATSLARLRARQGRHADADEVLAPVFRSFDDGFKTPDLKSAGELLKALKRASKGRAPSRSTGVGRG